ncbi:MAG: peptidase G2 autoproteolytic cleavage domain-containing protein [Pyrinomonadaceae bacterium]
MGTKRPGTNGVAFGAAALLTLVLCLCRPAEVRAQWTTSGSNNITTTNNVGVGTTAPGTQLEIRKDVSGDIGPTISLTNNTGGTNAGAAIDFTLPGWTYPQARIRSLDNNDWSANLAFFTKIPGGSTNNIAERMRITSTGSVGIGTSAPSSLLHLYSSARPALTISDAAATAKARIFRTTAAQSDFAHTVAYDGTGWSLDDTAAGGSSISLGTNFVGINQWSAGTGYRTTTTPFYISSTGNVGIGTTAPSARLHISKGGGMALTALSGSVTAGQWTGLQIGRTAADGTLGVSSQTGDFTANSAAGDVILRTESATSRLILNSGTGNSTLVVVNGNVGVGTTAPGSKLDVAGNVNAAGLCLSDGCKATWSQVGGTASQWTTATPTPNIYFTGGNVGIGTQNPIRGLHIAGPNYTIGAEFILENTGMPANNRKFNLWGDSTQGGAGRFFFRLLNDAGSAVTKDFLSFDNATGNVGIGTTNPAYKLDVSGAINASGAITGSTITATYQDVAEWVPSTQKLSAGTVVVLDRERVNHVLASTSSYDTGVAGVVSEQPGVVLGRSGANKLMVATTGRVKVKVDATRAPIHIGDLIVTSDMEGVAMKSEPISIGGRKLHAPGTIIGKALEPLEKGTGEILVLLSLQ